MDTLLVLAPVKAERLASLADVLAQIGRDPGANPFVRLPDSPLTHFARWNLVTDDDHGTRLLFSAGYDGPLDEYVAELASISPGLDDLYDHCEGYEGRASFATFVTRFRCQARGVYMAFPDDTVADLRGYVATRQEIQRFLDLPDVARFLRDPGVGPLLERIAAVPDEGSGRSLRRLKQTTVPKVQKVYRKAFIPFAKGFAGFGQAKSFPKVSPAPRLGEPAPDPTADLAPPVSGAAGLHNGLTVLLDVAEHRHARLNAALVLSNALTKHGYGEGEFADIGTIHWFAWAVVDDGKRLLFASVYDGSWLQYVQDFVDKLQWGLDAIFGNAAGYPEAGMKDVAAFSAFMGSKLVPIRAMYCAYPDDTVLNLIRDRKISHALAGALDRDALDEWLRLL